MVDFGAVSPVSNECLVRVAPYVGDIGIADECDGTFSIVESSGVLTGEFIWPKGPGLGVCVRPDGRALVVNVPAAGPHSVEVVGINGLLVAGCEGSALRSYSFDTSQFGAGVYIVRVRTNEGTLVQRIGIR